MSNCTEYIDRQQSRRSLSGLTASPSRIEGNTPLLGGSTSPVVNVGEAHAEPLDHIRLSVPSIVEVERKCLPRFKDWVFRQYHRLRSRVTLNLHRLGFQWAVALGLSSLPLFSNSVHSFFNGSEIFIPISAVTVFDPTVGGHVRKVLDRLGGNGAAFVFASVVFVPLSVAGYDDLNTHQFLNWLLYANAIAIAFFWGYVSLMYPKHITLPFVGLSASMTMYIMTTRFFLESMWRIALCNVIGALVGAFAFRYVLPKRARRLIQNDLVQVLEKMGDTLEPLVDFEAGLVSSASFFERRPVRRPGNLIRKLSRRTASRLNPSASWQESASGVLTSNNLSPPQRVQSITYALFKDFRDDLWQRVESVYTLLGAQEALLRPAEREYSRTAPHKFPTAAYHALLGSVKRLFYQIVSLYLVLDAQGAVASTEFPTNTQDVLGTQWGWAGTVKIHREKSREEASAVSSTAIDIRQHFTLPGLGNALRPPSPDFLSKRRRYLSDPVIKDPAFSDMGELAAEPIPKPQPTPPPERKALRLESPAVTMQRQDRLKTLESLSSLIAQEVASLEPHLTSPYTLEEEHDLIGSTPVMQWTAVYGPLIAQVSKGVARTVFELAECLKSKQISDNLLRCLGKAEEAMKNLSEQRYVKITYDQKDWMPPHSRNSWHRTVQNLFNTLLLGNEDRGSEWQTSLQQDVDSLLMQKWMGVSSSHFRTLPAESQDALWKSFGNMQDRLSTTVRTLLALVVELGACSRALESFATAMQGKNSHHSHPAESPEWRPISIP